jgi:hypothetical protein
MQTCWNSRYLHLPISDERTDKKRSEGSKQERSSNKTDDAGLERSIPILGQHGEESREREQASDERAVVTSVDSRAVPEGVAVRLSDESRLSACTVMCSPHSHGARQLAHTRVFPPLGVCIVRDFGYIHMGSAANGCYRSHVEFRVSASEVIAGLMVLKDFSPRISFRLRRVFWLHLCTCPGCTISPASDATSVNFRVALGAPAVRRWRPAVDHAHSIDCRTPLRFR